MQDGDADEDEETFYLGIVVKTDSAKFGVRRLCAFNLRLRGDWEDCTD